MKRFARLQLVMTAAVAVGLLVNRPAAAADPVKSDQLLPPEVTAFVSVPSVPELKSRWNKTLMGQLAEDESLAEFRRELEQAWEEWSAAVQAEIAVSLDELLQIPSGEVSFAVVQPAGQSLQVVGLVDVGENRETVDQLLQKADAGLQEQGATKSVRDFEGTTITVYEFDQGQDGAETPRQGAAPQTLAYFLRDSRLVGASDVSALEAVLARWDGDHPETFAQTEVYQYLRERTRTRDGDPAAVWYVDLLGLLRGVLQTAGPQAQQGAQMFMGMLPLLGLNQLQAFGGSTDVATEEFDTVSRTLVSVDQPTQGLLNVFHFPATEQLPPEWVSADVAGYYAFNWNVSKAWSAVETLVNTFQGPGAFAQLMDQLSSAGPMIHPKEDFIDQLTGTIHVVSGATEFNVQQPPVPKFLIALEVKDAEKMRSVLESVSRAEGVQLETRQFRGTTIYETPAGVAAQTGGAKPAVAVTRGHLMTTTDVTLLEQVIRGDSDQQPLAESDAYRRLAEHFPDRTSLLGFQRQETQVRAFYDLLRSGPIGQQIPNIDFSTLPPFEEIAEYFPPAGSYAVPDERGVLFVSFTLDQGTE